MAWTAPRTWLAGEKITAALLNAQIKANLDELANPPGALVTNAAEQSIPNNAQTALTYDTEIYDVGGCHSGALATLTAPVNGKYAAWIGCIWAAHATGARWIYLSCSSGASNVGTAAPTFGSIFGTYQNAYAVYSMTAGQTVSSTGYQTSGVALNLTKSQFGLHLLQRG